MIDKYVSNMALKLTTHYPDELPPYGITRYGLKFIITNVIPVIMLLLIGLWIGNINNVFVSIVSFSILRMTSGGYHSDYPELCLMYSSILILVIADIGNLVSGYEWVCFVISLILIVIYAPSNIENQTKILKKYFIYLKYISIFTVLVGLFMKNPIVSLSMLAQSLLLIRLRGGEKND